MTTKRTTTKAQTTQKTYNLDDPSIRSEMESKWNSLMVEVKTKALQIANARHAIWQDVQLRKKTLEMMALAGYPTTIAKDFTMVWVPHIEVAHGAITIDKTSIAPAIENIMKIAAGWGRDPSVIAAEIQKNTLTKHRSGFDQTVHWYGVGEIETWADLFPRRQLREMDKAVEDAMRLLVAMSMPKNFDKCLADVLLVGALDDFSPTVTLYKRLFAAFSTLQCVRDGRVEVDYMPSPPLLSVRMNMVEKATGPNGMPDVAFGGTLQLDSQFPIGDVINPVVDELGSVRKIVPKRIFTKPKHELDMFGIYGQQINNVFLSVGCPIEWVFIPPVPQENLAKRRDIYEKR